MTFLVRGRLKTPDTAVKIVRSVNSRPRVEASCEEPRFSTSTSTFYRRVCILGWVLGTFPYLLCVLPRECSWSVGWFAPYAIRIGAELFAHLPFMVHVADVGELRVLGSRR